MVAQIANQSKGLPRYVVLISAGNMQSILLVDYASVMNIFSKRRNPNENIWRMEKSRFYLY